MFHAFILLHKNTDISKSFEKPVSGTSFLDQSSLKSISPELFASNTFALDSTSELNQIILTQKHKFRPR